MSQIGSPFDWSAIDVVVFDVDGTLYDQRRLRLRMLGEILGACARARSLELALTLREFRRVREEMAEGPDDDFRARQFAMTAERRRRSPLDVERLVAEWIDARPIPFLMPCRFPDVDRVFASLRNAGKTIAVFSDYPAREKLAALGLEADLVVSACDADVGRLKPHPAGLRKILRATGAAPERCVMIGDRASRDGEAARRAGMRALLRSQRPQGSIATFRSYAEDPFRSLMSLPASAEADCEARQAAPLASPL